MKVRTGWVSNSSSTAFMMTNRTGEAKDLVDFVKETPWIIEAWVDHYGPWDPDYEKQFTQENLIKSAQANNITFEPHEKKIVIFGDEQGTLIGRVYDYMLRGRDLSKAAQLMKEFESLPEGSPEAKVISEQWFEAIDQREDNFSGVDSDSFEVRFHEWLR